MIAGESVGLIHEILAAREVVETMVRDAAVLIKREASHIEVEA